MCRVVVGRLFSQENVDFQISNFKIKDRFADNDDDDNDDHDDNDDCENKSKKTKCVSNDRSRHEDQFCPKIVKIGAILGG